VELGNPESEAKLFSVPDFIGFACREVGELFALTRTTHTCEHTSTL